MGNDEFRQKALLTQLVEAWKDIRSYTSSIWQVTTVCLAVVGLAINILLTGRYNDISVYGTVVGWMVLAFVSAFLLVALRMLNWFMAVLSTRAHFIQKAEGDLGIIGMQFPSDEVPPHATTGDFKGQSWGYVFFYEGQAVPLILFLFFYIIAAISNLLMILHIPGMGIEYLPLSIVTVILILALIKLVYDTIRLLSRRRFSMEVDSIDVQFSGLKEKNHKK